MIDMYPSRDSAVFFYTKDGSDGTADIGLAFSHVTQAEWNTQHTTLTVWCDSTYRTKMIASVGELFMKAWHQWAAML